MSPNSSYPSFKTALRACEQHDTSLMAEAISRAEGQPDDESQHLLIFAVEQAIRNNSTDVLSFLISRGAEVTDLSSNTVLGAGKTSTDILEILIAHGWDINSRGRIGSSVNTGPPIMWYMVSEHEKVAWCLDHGATVDHRIYDGPTSNSTAKSASISTVATSSAQRQHQPESYRCPPILDRAAASGTVMTYKLLKSKGAPSGWQSLPLAVEAATAYNTSNGKPDESRSHTERMAMVRHLVEVEKVDVNALDQPLDGPRLPNRLGSPLCYIPGSNAIDFSCRDQYNTQELTSYLLDHGADPSSALQLAAESTPKDQIFIRDVTEWQAQHNKRNQ